MPKDDDTRTREILHPDADADAQPAPQDGPLTDEATLVTGEVYERTPDGRWRLSRRQLVATGAVAGVAGAALSGRAFVGVQGQEATPDAPPDTADEAREEAAEAGPEHDMEAMDVAPETNGGFTVFVPYQAAIIEAAAARLIPTDDLGPGATEAGVVYFIDRQLNTERGYRGKWYQQGPFIPGEATQGDQSGMRLRDRFRIGIEGMDQYSRALYDRGFAELEPDEQDRILNDMDAGIPEEFGGTALQTIPTEAAGGGPESIEQAGARGVGAKAFFDLLLMFTFSGFFADPVQGGNRDMVGWRLIGFPGAHIGYAGEILNYGQPFEGDYISLAQYQRTITGG